MTALDEIKKALEGDMNTGLTAIDRLQFIVGGIPDFDPITVEDAEWIISALERLQSENDEKSAWIKAATTEITKAIGGGSEMFTKHGDDFRVDPAFVASFIQYRRERHAESKKASIQKERELLARAEAAEAEVKLIREAVGEFLDQAEHVCMGAHTPLDIKESARNLTGPIAKVRTALASTGGEHHGN
ncbi:hypothetical protein G6L74_05985 [Agrobacterium tumefaciens]|uniref:hypothetical protein n=1 Tax=Agrobacterium tumefaciens TaxID=358 RepID=UPI001571FEE9|nr:hypothetical protein [Agrobacterium tumefaciens]